MQTARKDAGATLEEVEKKFEAWRKNRTRRGPIPRELLELTAGVAGKHKLGTIARTLRINQRSLKKKLQEYGTGKSQGDNPGFVEIPMRWEPGKPRPWGEEGEMLEIESPNGYKARFYTSKDLSHEMKESLKLIYGREE